MFVGVPKHPNSSCGNDARTNCNSLRYYIPEKVSARTKVSATFYRRNGRSWNWFDILEIPR